jgi:hypothetical protein
MNDLDLQACAKVLNLNGLLAHWTQVATESWVQTLIDWEEQERANVARPSHDRTWQKKSKHHSAPDPHLLDPRVGLGRL